MKTTLLFSAIVLFSGLTTRAQIIVDSSDFLQPGDVIYLATDTALLDVSITPGNSGPNQIWDFSALVNDNPDTLYGKLPSQVAGNASFPNANLAIEQAGQPNLFLINSASQFVLDGVYGVPPGTNDSIPIDYNPDKKMALFPVNYLDFFFDTTGYDIRVADNSFPGVDSARVKHREYVNAQIDGFGILKTPFGTFNVLREYDQLMTIDSVWIRFFGTWSFLQAVVSNKDAYTWVTKNAGWPMADMELDTSGNITSVSAIYYPPIDSAVITQPVPSCNVTCDETATAVPAGGTPPYAYAWSNGDTGATTDSLCAGIYYVTVSDFTSNFIVDSIIINDPDTLSTNIVITDATCSNLNDGSIDQAVSGGTAPYSFNWSNGSTAEDPSALTSGMYYLTITDGNNCSTTDSAEVLEIFVIALNRTITDVSCFGGNNGVIDITVSGGNTPYVYSWSNSDSTEDISGLTAGDYTVTITDSLGCQEIDTRNVAEPAVLATSISGTDVSCNGASDGDANLTVNGGTTPYQYLWSNTETTEDITGLITGTYYVTITDDNSCTAVDSITVNGPALLSSSIAATNVSCNGGSDGAANLTATGGSGNFQYDWSSSDNTEDISGLSAGTFIVTVVDVTCSDTITDSVTITEPALFSGTTSVTDVLCNGASAGAINLIHSGGSGFFSYTWSNSATTEDLIAVTAGIYTVTVTDTVCSNIAQFSDTIAEPTAIVITVDSTFNTTCNGIDDGSIYISVSGGTGPYLYAWSNLSTIEDNTGLGSGIYTIIITDGNGCTATATDTVDELSGILIALDSVINVACNGGNDGAIYITATGGTGALSSLWSNSATTDDISGLTADTYTDTVSDPNGCVATLTVTITEVALVSGTLSVTDVSCGGGSDGAVNLIVTGGSGQFDYLWSTSSTTEDISGLVAGTYDVTVTDTVCADTITGSAVVNESVQVSASAVADSVNCYGGSDGSVNLTIADGSGGFSYLWSDGSSTEDIAALSADVYNVTVVDTVCSDTVIVNVWVNEPAVVNIIADSLFGVSCNGNNDGAIFISAAGGNGGFSYVWNTTATTNNIIGLAPATYTVTATDSKGCTDVDSFDVAEPAVLTVNFTSTDAFCYGACDGSATAGTNGGTPPYMYSWSFGLTSSTGSAMFLCAGAGDVTVTDVNGCTATDAYTVNEPAALVVTVNPTNAKCNGNCDGTAVASTSGGIAPYFYYWSTGLTSTSDTHLFLCNASYTVTVGDNNGCNVSETFTITEPPPMSVITMISNATCFGNCDGSADVFAVFGGTWPYTYNWSNGDNTSTADSLCAGSHNVVITDSLGCIDTTTINISEPTALAIDSITSTDETAQGDSNGTASVYVTPGSGTFPYTYVWDDPSAQTDSAATGLSTGWYTVKITDANGCTRYDSVLVDVITSIRCYLDGTKRIRIYPVPASDELVIVNGSRVKDLRLTIRDVSGKVVAEQFSSGAMTRMDIRFLPDGIYLLEADDRIGNILLRKNIIILR